MCALIWDRPNSQRRHGVTHRHGRRFAMVTWKVLPWVVVILIVSLGRPAGSAATKNPTCVTSCVAAFAYCELQAHVTEDKGIAACVTNATTTTPKGCSDLLMAAGKACPQPVP